MLSNKFNVKSFFFETKEKLHDFARDNMDLISEKMKELKTFNQDLSGKLITAGVGVAVVGTTIGAEVARATSMPMAAADQAFLGVMGATALCIIGGLMTKKPHKDASVGESVRHNVRAVYDALRS